MDEWLSVQELTALGFRHVGVDTKVSRKGSYYHIDGSIGDHTRVDDFCTLKGQLNIGSYVHISAYSLVSGMAAPVTFKDFSGLSARVTVLACSDDYRASTLSNPQPPEKYVTLISGPVTFGVGALVGAHCVILPSVTIGDGASVGSGCVIFRDVPDGGMVLMPRAELREGRRRDYKKILEMADQVLREAQ